MVTGHSLSQKTSSGIVLFRHGSQFHCIYKSFVDVFQTKQYLQVTWMLVVNRQLWRPPERFVDTVWLPRD